MCPFGLAPKRCKGSSWLLPLPLQSPSLDGAIGREWIAPSESIFGDLASAHAPNEPACPAILAGALILEAPRDLPCALSSRRVWPQERSPRRTRVARRIILLGFRRRLSGMDGAALLPLWPGRIVPTRAAGPDHATYLILSGSCPLRTANTRRRRRTSAFASARRSSLLNASCVWACKVPGTGSIAEGGGG